MSKNEPVEVPTPATADDRRPTTVTISTGPTEETSIELVLEQVPLANRHAVARAGLRVGLAALLENPSLIVDALRDEKMRIVPRGGAR